MASHNSDHPTALQPVEQIQKPVSTLALVPKAGSITRIARQAYTIMMLMARDQEAADDLFHAPVNSIVRGFDGAQGSIDELKRHLRSMVTHVVEWQSPTTEESVEWGVCALLAEVRLYKRHGENWVSWAYPPTLKQEMLAPSRYAQLRKSTISRFRTHAGLALYEICARYKDNPAGLTSRQSWRWWVPVLTGKPEKKDSKKEFRYFNRDTLMPAIAEVNEVSELDIAIVEHKQGRSVDALQFKVRLKTVEKAPERVNMAAVTLAITLGIDRDVAEDLYFRYGDYGFSLAVEKLNQRIANGIPIVSKLAYLRKLLTVTELGSEPAPIAEKTVKRGRAVRDTSTPQEPTPQSEHHAAPIASLVVAQLESQQIASESDRIALVRHELFGLEADAMAQLLAELKADMQERNVPRATIQRLNDGKWQSALVLGELVRFYWKKTRHTEWVKG